MKDDIPIKIIIQYQCIRPDTTSLKLFTGVS